MIKPRLLLQLFTLSSRPGGQSLRVQRGVALPITIFVILAVTLGIASVIAVAANGRLGAARLGESREAREAAEAGMATVISELNRRQNRKLLVADVPINSWDASDLKLRNPCAPTTAPTAAALNLRNNTPVTIAGSGGNRQFVLKTIALKNFDRGARFVSSVDAGGPGGTAGTRTGSFTDNLVNLTRLPGADPNVRNVGYIEVTVEGRVLRGGNQVSTARITREFQVVPKCCNLSFNSPGNAHGNDNRFCGDSFPRILVGLNGRGFNTPGNAQQLRVQNPDGSTSATKPANVLCITQDQNRCGPDNLPKSVDGVPIQPIEVSLPALPLYPDPSAPATGITIRAISRCESTSQIIARGTKNEQCNSNVVDSDRNINNARDYLRVNAAGQVQLCNAKDNNLTTSLGGAGGEPNLPTAFVAGSCDSTINDFCTTTDAGTPQVAYHCRIRRLEVSDDTVNDGEDNRKQNNTFFIDTSRGPIYLYFNTAWSTGSAPTGINAVANWDDGQIQHINCASPSDTTPCATRALPDASSRAGIFSDRDITVSIGDDGFIRDVFTYLPRGTLELRPDPDSSNNAFGLPNYRGSAWLDQLIMGNLGTSSNPTGANTTQFAVPPPSLSFFGAGNSLNAPFGPLIFDWVARSVTANSLF